MGLQWFAWLLAEIKEHSFTKADSQASVFELMASLTAFFKPFPHKGSIPRIPAVSWNQEGPKRWQKVTSPTFFNSASQLIPQTHYINCIRVPYWLQEGMYILMEVGICWDLHNQFSSPTVLLQKLTMQTAAGWRYGKDNISGFLPPRNIKQPWWLHTTINRITV